MTDNKQVELKAWNWWLKLGEMKRLEIGSDNYGKTVTELYNMFNNGTAVQECDASKAPSMGEPLANNSPKDEDVEKMAEAILMKYWNADDLEDLQMSITLNPQVQFFILAMIEMYNAAKTTK